MTLRTKDTTSVAGSWQENRTLPDVELREARPEDKAFLIDVYKSSRASEMALAPWTEEQKDYFLRDQYRLQDIHYKKYYPGAEFLVIEKGGVPIGRLYACAFPDRLQFMDIAILPEHQRQGIGTALVEHVCLVAFGLGLKVQLQVEAFNHAVRIYQRLGFRMISEGDNLYEVMELTEQDSRIGRCLA